MDNKIESRIKNLKISARFNRIVSSGCTLVAFFDAYNFIKMPNFSSAFLGFTFAYFAFEQASRAYDKGNEIEKYQLRLVRKDKKDNI